jgi:hypothetical protein
MSDGCCPRGDGKYLLVHAAVTGMVTEPTGGKVETREEKTELGELEIGKPKR